MAKKTQLCFDKADIKVLMLGASRVGKTSILASMTDNLFLNRATNGSDLELVVNEEGSAGHLNSARQIMAGYFDPNQSDEGSNASGAKRTRFSKLTLNDGPSFGEIDFSLLLRTKGKRESYSIGFTDIPGEWVNNINGGLDSADKTQLQNLVSVSDVLIVTIDSVLLMEGGGAYCRDGNKVDNVTSLIKDFCRIDKDNKNPYKMILFVPVKCEKYYLRHLKYADDAKAAGYDYDPMDELIAHVEKEYSDLFEYLSLPSNKPFFNVAILPVLTLGNIEFKMFKAGATGVRTAKDMLFGYNFQTGETVGNNVDLPPHAPMYCEQPLLYILLYELAKIKKLSDDKSFFAKIGDAFKGLFMRMSKDTDLIAQAPKISKNAVITGYNHRIVSSPLPIIIN